MSISSLGNEVLFEIVMHVDNPYRLSRIDKRFESLVKSPEFNRYMLNQMVQHLDPVDFPDVVGVIDPAGSPYENVKKVFDRIKILERCIPRSLPSEQYPGFPCFSKSRVIDFARHVIALAEFQKGEILDGRIENLIGQPEHIIALPSTTNIARNISNSIFRLARIPEKSFDGSFTCARTVSLTSSKLRRCEGEWDGSIRRVESAAAMIGQSLIKIGVSTGKALRAYDSLNLMGLQEQFHEFYAARNGHSGDGAWGRENMLEYLPKFEVVMQEFLSDIYDSKSEEDRNFTNGQIYQLASNQMRRRADELEPNPNWGQEHRFDDLEILAKAVAISSLNRSFENLPNELQEQVCFSIFSYHKARIFRVDPNYFADPNFGYNRRFDNLELLAREINKAFGG
ncbi:MAG: hypothetical protein KAR79_02410 [Simkaniaceae bacterium]|nr:hypothetical protein [Simkaniaceae bacterium]